MIKYKLFELIPFIEASAKTPSFLKSFDRVSINVDDTLRINFFTTSEVWPASLA
jgi:hypothetical protein